MTVRSGRPGVVTVRDRAYQIGEHLMFGEEGWANGNSFSLEKRPHAKVVPCWRFGISVEAMMAGAVRV
jgi:hypothetical protein